MLEVLEFMFRDGWHFVGSLVLILAIGVAAGLALPRALVSIKHYHGDEE